MMFVALALFSALNLILTGVVQAEARPLPRAGTRGSVADPSCTGVTKRGGGWSTIALPDLPENPLQTDGRYATSYVVDPIDPKTIFYGIRNRIFRSADGGCSNNWDEVLSPDDFPAFPCLDGADFNDTLYVQSMSMATGKDGSRIYAQVTNQTDYITYDLWSCVLASDDGGASWTSLAGQSAEMLGGIGELYVDPHDPDSILVTRSSRISLVSGSIFVSEDGGASWATRSLPPGARAVERSHGAPNNQGRCNALDINPRDQDELWVLADDGIHRSEDLGASWELVIGTTDYPWKDSGGYVNDIEIASTSTGSPTVLANLQIYDGGNRGELWTTKDLVVWTRQAVPTNGWGIGCIQASGRDATAITSQDLATRYDLVRGTAISIKTGPFSDGFAGDFQGAAHYVPQSGLYFLILPLSGTSKMLALYEGGN